MPRRASSGVNIGQIIGIAVAIIAFFAIAAVLIFLIAGDLFGGSGGSRGNSRAEPIDVSSYLDNANSLRGNQYRVDGTIQSMLRWTDRGRLISFEANDGQMSSPVPILVPEEIKNNLERGAEMSFDVEVGRDGTLNAIAVNK